MNANRSTVDGMTWTRYVDAIAPRETRAAIAARIGITPPSVGRWYSQGSLPDPATAATFARVYGRPVLEAFVAAGFLTPEEARETPSAPPTLASLNDDELLAEVRRRMQGGQSDAGTAEAEKSRDSSPEGEALGRLASEGDDGPDAEMLAFPTARPPGWRPKAARREDPERDPKGPQE